MPLLPPGPLIVVDRMQLNRDERAKILRIVRGRGAVVAGLQLERDRSGCMDGNARRAFMPSERGLRWMEPGDCGATA